jgi:hypothetical protein
MKFKLLAVLFVSAVMMFDAAQANTVTGNLWHVPEAISQNAVPANVPGTTPDVEFDVNSPFNFFGSSTTVGNWLASSGAFNIVENTPGTLTSLMDDFNQGTLIKFSGSVTVSNGQTFTVTHDDGLTLIIGAVDLGFNPGPTAPITSTATYTGPSGTFPFELVYGECCGGAAVLQVDLPFVSVPICPNDPDPPVNTCLAVIPFKILQNPLRKVGQFQLLASDNCDPDPKIYVGDSRSSFVAGPFHNLDFIEIGAGPSMTPNQHAPLSGPNVAVVFTKGDPLVWAVDSSGNASTPVKCK